MSNTFDGLRELLGGSYPPPEQEPLTIESLERLIKGMVQWEPAPADHLPDHFYWMDTCLEHEGCVIVKPCTWDGPINAGQHMQRAEWMQAVELSGWVQVSLGWARAQGYKG